MFWKLYFTRGGVEDTRLEAKAKDTKKIRGQGQGQPFRGQTLSRPRPRTQVQRKCSPKKKRSSRKFFKRTPKKKKKKVFTKIFHVIRTFLHVIRTFRHQKSGLHVIRNQVFTSSEIFKKGAFCGAKIS